MKNAEEISNSLRKVLDNHGHSFQYAVIKKFEVLRNEGKSPWHLIATEFPATVNNQTVHIDLIYQHEHSNVFMVGECKRVNPAYSEWAFVKAPYTFNLRRNTFTFFDFVKWLDRDYVNYGCKLNTSETPVAHLGLELKSGEKGDNAFNQNSSINSAVAQVLRSSSGAMNNLMSKKRAAQLEKDSRHTFLPVIFTTANLWYSDADISLASIETGKLETNEINAQKQKWLWFNHNRSLDLTHNLPHSFASEIYQEFDKEFTRSIAIVSPEGIEEFLGEDWNSWNYFGYN